MSEVNGWQIDAVLYPHFEDVGTLLDVQYRFMGDNVPYDKNGKVVFQIGTSTGEEFYVWDIIACEQANGFDSGVFHILRESDKTFRVRFTSKSCLDGVKYGLSCGVNNESIWLYPPFK